MSANVMTEDNLFDYFHERVEHAKCQQTVPLSENTTLYLASLLTERARIDRPAPQETTLVELHLRAANAPPGEQARTYRELGDRALYVLGYFSESLERSPVGPSYYTEMGTAAYQRVDTVFKQWFSDAFGPVFGELATHFSECVELIEQVRTGETEDSDDMVRLYERWLATGSEKYATRLRAKGIIVPRRKVEG